MPQLTISLKPSEKEALILLADQERRKMADQAALIIVSELQRRGLVEKLSTAAKPNEMDMTDVQSSR